LEHQNSPENSNQEEPVRCEVLPAAELLRREGRRIEVPENAEVLLSPSNPEFAPFFYQVPLRSYDDLQLLGFVPRRLSEERVRRAIAEDDDEAYRLAISAPLEAAADCECSGGANMSRAGRFRGAYNALRARHNPALARLLSEHYGARVEWDSPVAGIVRRWADALRPEYIAIIALLEDITINRNATLFVAPSAKSLLAHNIWIHRTGTLRQQGSYLRVWANSINHFSNVLVQFEVEALRRARPVWLASE
jgi:hypothetical protein